MEKYLHQTREGQKQLQDICYIPLPITYISIQSVKRYTQAYPSLKPNTYRVINPPSYNEQDMSKYGSHIKKQSTKKSSLTTVFQC